jgi:hypothetical protein
MLDMTYDKAIKNAEHLIALGQTTQYLYEGDMPWHIATDVEVGGTYRMNGPAGVYIIGKEAGLTLKWSVDFEGRSAKGASTHQFERDRLRDVMMKLPKTARIKFAKILRKEVLPGIEKNTAEWREMLNRQVDSEDCVRGLIDFAERQ